MKTKHTAGVLLLVCLTAASAMADNLGIANQFNGFILGNSNETSDVMGRYAVGGNANVNLTIGSGLPANQDLNLVVGGDFTMNANTIHGSAFVGGNVNWHTPTISGNVTANGSVTTSSGTMSGNVTYGTTASLGSTTVSGTVSQGTTASPIDFSAAASELQGKSTSWSAIAANGTAVNSYGTLTLTGTDSQFDVFNVTPTLFSGINTLAINAPTGATVLVNIGGTSGSWSGGLNLNGVDANHVIYNFYQATSLNMHGIGVQGSILAPFADLNFSSGQIDGTLVAGSLTGGVELHNYEFQGAVQSVPEPSALVALALPGLGLFFRRRRR